MSHFCTLQLHTFENWGRSWRLMEVIMYESLAVGGLVESGTPLHSFLRRSTSAERDRVSLDWVPWFYLLSHGQTIRIGTKFEVLRYKTWVCTLTHINSVVFNVKGGCVFTVASQYLSVRRKSKVRDEGTTGECRTHVHREVLNTGSWGQLSIFRSQLTAGRKLSLPKGACNHMRNSNENVGKKKVKYAQDTSCDFFHLFRHKVMHNIVLL